MNRRQSLIVDTDLEMINPSGVYIRLRLDAGRGSLELNDAAFFRGIMRGLLFKRRNRNGLRRLLAETARLGPGIDLSVADRQVAKIDIGRGGFFCALAGLPGLRISPLGLIRVLFR